MNSVGFVFHTPCLVPKNVARRKPVVKCQKPINPGIDKDSAKVVTTVKVADMPVKGVFCRCWRSAKFPYCDGTHAKFNAETGDNVGPLIIDKKE